jgi:hypothetical protein
VNITNTIHNAELSIPRLFESLATQTSRAMFSAIPAMSMMMNVPPQAAQPTAPVAACSFSSAADCARRFPAEISKPQTGIIFLITLIFVEVDIFSIQASQW